VGRANRQHSGMGDAFSNFLGEDKFGAARKPRVHVGAYLYNEAENASLCVCVCVCVHIPALCGYEETRISLRFDSWRARLGIFLIHRRRVMYRDAANN